MVLVGDVAEAAWCEMMEMTMKAATGGGWGATMTVATRGREEGRVGSKQRRSHGICVVNKQTMAGRTLNGRDGT